VLVQQKVRETVERLVSELSPDVVGLSVMTFQRKTAKKIIDLVRQLKPNVRVAVGGYDPSLAPEAYTDNSSGVVDFIVRGEGEITFRKVLRAIEEERGFDHIAGPSYRSGDRFYHTQDRPVNGLKSGEIKLPNRDARVLKGYTILGRPVDVIETSRGCTYDCSFRSIIEMRGRNFHTYTFDRAIADIRDAHEHGALVRPRSWPAMMRPSSVTNSQLIIPRSVAGSRSPASIRNCSIESTAMTRARRIVSTSTSALDRKFEPTTFNCVPGSIGYRKSERSTAFRRWSVHFLSMF
jgi:hypothetical protein